MVSGVTTLPFLIRRSNTAVAWQSVSFARQSYYAWRDRGKGIKKLLSRASAFSGGYGAPMISCTLGKPDGRHAISAPAVAVCSDAFSHGRPSGVSRVAGKEAGA